MATSGSTGKGFTVALVDDYDVVVLGLAQMLEPYRDRVVIAEIDTNKGLHDEVDAIGGGEVGGRLDPAEDGVADGSADEGQLVPGRDEALPQLGEQREGRGQVSQGLEQEGAVGGGGSGHRVLG